MLFNRAVYSLTREMYVAGCELHIQTPTLLIFLTLKTICQRQNHLRKWSSKHQSPIARLSQFTRPRSQLTFKVFPVKWVVLWPSLQFISGLQSSVCILPSVCTLSPVCSLQSELCGLRFTLTDIVSEKLTIWKVGLII